MTSPFSRLFWRVIPWPTDLDQTPPEDCICYCDSQPDRAITRGDSLWYVCPRCAPRLGWSLGWPTRRAKRLGREG